MWATPATPRCRPRLKTPSQRILKAGKAPGILSTSDEAQARKYLEMGALFVAVGLDTNLLVRATTCTGCEVQVQHASPARQQDLLTPP
jgi:4-hydroxy-2-oxoheptanedioate aldolase